ncbi:MAG: hypothetical protein FWG43_05385 [Clostridiales bacterium]|nr:hypothetical protein [Clostridiales bacterium]
MSYLLDTHIILWILKGESISVAVKLVLDDVTTEVYVSMVSVWEVGSDAHIVPL